MLRLMVWPKGEPAKIVVTKSKETGKDIKTEIPRIPLFRCLASINDMESWKLSGFNLDFRASLWPRWEFVENVEAMKNDPDAPKVAMPMINVTGTVDQRKNITATTSQSILPTDLPYKANEFRGSFGYDKQTGKTMPLNEGNVIALIKAIRNQTDNPDTVGRRDDNTKPRILWIPFLPDQDAEGDEYEANLAIFKTWVGKIVYWEFEEVEVKARR